MSRIVSLWELLKRNRVVIPIIQRDYAQGRAGKEYIRSTFLAEIKNNLDNKKKLILDFVYAQKFLYFHQN